MNADILTLILVGIVAICLVAFSVWFTRKLGSVEPRETSMARTIAELNATVTTLRKKLDEADLRIRALETENASFKARITELEAQTKVTVNDIPARPLLVICGTDASVFDRDRDAIRRARVPFQRLKDANATKDGIKAEFRRARQSGNLYPWVLVSTHAGPQGIVLNDGIADPSFWGDILDGISVVVLASCEASTTADEIAGLVDYVIWFKESVGNTDAADFNYSFWRRLMGGTEPNKAFYEAIREVPQVSEFVDIRSV